MKTFTSTNPGAVVPHGLGLPTSWWRHAASLVACLLISFSGLAQETFLATNLENKIVIGPLEIHPDRHEGHRNQQVFIGRDVYIPAGQTNHDLVVVLGNATIAGTVSGNFTVVLGNVEVEKTGRVLRDMALVGTEPVVEEGATFQGFRGPVLIMPLWLTQGLQDWLKKGLLVGRPLPHQLSWAWWVVAALLALNFLIALLLPAPLNHCVSVLTQRPLSCFLTGMVICLLLGPLTALLVVSVVGAPAVPLMACVVLAGLVLGKLAVYRYAGEQLASHLGAGFLQHNLSSLGVGLVLFSFLYAVPVLGLVVLGLVAMMGLGTAVLAGFLAFNRESPAPASPQIPFSLAPGKPDLTAAQSRETDAAETILLDRAGFWLRLVACLIDLLLIGVLLRGLVGREAGEFFVPVFVLYHLGFWAWKGTTVGGIAVGLRIVQLDGMPLNVSGALIRWMASFLSALALGLGFFWAGWSQEKQSWHDMLAGTVIVKIPRNVCARTFSQT